MDHLNHPRTVIVMEHVDKGSVMSGDTENKPIPEELVGSEKLFFLSFNIIIFASAFLRALIINACSCSICF